MCFFDATFLTAPHRITIVNAGSNHTVWICLQVVGLTKLNTAISKDDREYTLKLINAPEGLFHGVQSSFYEAWFM